MKNKDRESEREKQCEFSNAILFMGFNMNCGVLFMFDVGVSCKNVSCLCFSV